MTLLRDLIALHRVDAQVRALRGRVDSARRYLSVQERQVEDLDQQSQDLSTQLRQLHAQVGNNQNEMRALDERIAKIRGELNATTNSKQYTMLLGGLKTVENDQRDLQEQAATLNEKITQVQAKLDALQGVRSERGGLRDSAQGELDQRLADVSERLAELERERARAASAIPPDELAVFDRVAALHDGEAMSSVVTISARHREYACGACNCEIPFESYSRLRGHPNSIVQCLNCQRILHLEQVEEAHA